MRPLAFILFCALQSCGFGQSAEREPLTDKEALIVSFEPIMYPLYARVRHIEGVVILRADVDVDGGVTKATPVSGPKSLQKPSAENLMKWRFLVPRSGSVFVVYWYRFRGLCNPPCSGNFEFYASNLAIITSGEMLINP